jgi:hypothetical protein
MRIYLVSPSHDAPDGSIHKTTRYWTSGRTLPYLKRLHMTDSQMMDGFKDVYSSFYSLGAIARRLLPPPHGNWLETAAYAVANVNVNRFLRRNPDAWGTIS